MAFLANCEVRETARLNNVFLWEVAIQLGISEATMTRKMRRELSACEKAQVLAAIDCIVTARKEVS